VHVPLSAEAQAEARILMLSSNNILKPADGKPVTMPTQDMIIGLYYLTHRKPGVPGEGGVFSSDAEATMALDSGELHLQAPIRIRMRDVAQVKNSLAEAPVDAPEGRILETTLGRVMFNETLPPEYPFVNFEVRKGQLSAIVNDLAERYPKVQLAATLDALKEAGFHWATWSGVTIGIEDVVQPPRKKEILERYEKEAERIDKQYQRGLMTAEERRGELIEIWTKATNEVAKELETSLPQGNPLWVMIHSVPGATCSSCARSPRSVVWWPTRRARSSRVRSSPRSVRVCRCWSTSSRPTVPARVWPTPRCGPPTRVT